MNRVGSFVKICLAVALFLAPLSAGLAQDKKPADQTDAMLKNLQAASTAAETARQAAETAKSAAETARKASESANTMARTVAATSGAAGNNPACTTGSIWCAIQNTTDELTAFLWPAATALAAIGILTMSIIELMKSVVQDWNPWSRVPFHRQRLLEDVKKGEPDTAAAGKVIGEIVDLATAGNAEALYDLPVEKMMGQINAAFQVVLANPERHEKLLRAMAHRADTTDIDLLVAGMPTDAAAKAAYTAARTRVSNQLQRRLDAMQIDWGNQWKRRMQRSAVGLSSLIIAGYAVYNTKLASDGQPKDFFTRETLYWIIIAVVGGMVAPVARDIVAALQSLRTRTR